MYTETIPTSIDRTAFGQTAMTIPTGAGLGAGHADRFDAATALASTAIRTETVPAFAAAAVATAAATVAAVTRITVELGAPYGDGGSAARARMCAADAVAAVDRARDAGNARDAVAEATVAIDRAVKAYEHARNAAWSVVSGLGKPA